MKMEPKYFNNISTSTYMGSKLFHLSNNQDIEQVDFYFQLRENLQPTVIARWGEEDKYFNCIELARYYALELSLSNNFKSLFEAMLYITENQEFQNFIGLFLIAQAARLAIENGYLDYNFQPCGKKH